MSILKFIKAHPYWLIVALVILLVNLFPPNEKNSVASGVSQVSTSELAPDGLTRGQWENRCQRYASARSECAVAAKVAQCIEIKVGEMDSEMSKVYCNGSTPNFSLMGMK